MSKQAIARIVKRDMRDNERLNLAELGIHLQFNEECVMEAKAMIIGPQGTPYENGLLFFEIEFPTDYPFSPPKVSYVSSSRIRIHPNLYVGDPNHHFQGKVCLSSLNTWTGPKWSTIMTIGSILITIQSLLESNPLKNEPGYESRSGDIFDIFNRIVEYDTMRQLIWRHSAILGDSVGSGVYEGFEGFNPIIRDHIVTHKEQIIRKISTLTSKYPKDQVWETGIYRMCVMVSYAPLCDRLIKLLNLI